MAISFNTSAHADSGNSQVASQNITVPAGVLSGDIVLLYVSGSTLTSTPPTFTVSSTGTTPAPAGSAVTGTEGFPAATSGQLYWFAATGTDAGKVITVTPSANAFMTLGIAAYTGASNSAPIDVLGGAFGGANTASVTCPAETTVSASDWAVFFGGGIASGSANGTLGLPASSTSRVNGVNGSAIGLAISDSNGPVGAAGTSIGGGTFTCGSSTNAILAGFTLGLAPPGSGTAHTATVSATIAPATVTTKRVGRAVSATIAPATVTTKRVGRAVSATVTPVTTITTGGGQRRGRPGIIPALVAMSVI